MKSANRFYVYAHINPANKQVFYVGRGTGTRIYSTHGRSSYWQNIVNKYSIEYQYLKENLTNTEANEWEKYYIRFYGRRVNGGTLINLTDGGEGLCGYKPTEETLKKQSLSLRGRIVKPVDEIAMMNDYKSGMTLRDLCAKYHLSVGKVSKHLDKTVRQQRHAENREKAAVKFYKGQTPWNKGLPINFGSDNHFFGKKHKDETKQRMAAKKEKAIICLNTGETFNSTIEAAEKLNLFQSSVAKVARGYQKQHKGFIFKYV